MKKFYVGIKAIIRTSEGVLLIKATDFKGGHWQFPGGRIDEGESIHETLKRELSEEITGTVVRRVSEVSSVLLLESVSFPGDIGLMLIYYDVDAELPSPIVLSDEHCEYTFIKSEDDIPTKDIDLELVKILKIAITNEG